MIRTWPALFAWGAGLIHLAVGASVVGGRHGWPAVVVLAGTLALGAAELGWGAAVLRAGRIVLRRGAAVAAIIAVALGAGALGAGASPLAVAAGSALAITGGSIAARARMAQGSGAAGGEESARSSRSRAAGMAVCAVLVAALVTPGLAFTDAGLHGAGHGHDLAVDLRLTDPHAHH
ncbi:hypothetical protein [Microbacterium capsulatum]|uniref:Uncharacterized protein n=1 Tax=Microbacterium capsulatum TaxID=3041921 RepID=A0ABU0XBS1_9MICO|nr:hypothetical protein [Microbacterium sp. ASV81]MDQ4212564.1 hypothetical protein [Microbacterium sp. ASV81]